MKTSKEQILADLKAILLSENGTIFKEELTTLLEEIEPKIEMANKGLEKAIKENNIENFKKYISLGANLNDKKGENLSNLIKICSVEMLQLATQYGLNLHYNFSEGYTAFTKAARRPDIEKLKYLLEKGLDINAKNSIALKFASQEGNVDCVKFLIENGADVHADLNIALQTACKNKHLPIVKLLVEANATINDTVALNELAKNGSVEIFKYLCSQETNIKEDQRLLNSACYAGHLNMVKYLIEEQKYSLSYLVNEEQIISTFLIALISCNVTLLEYILSKSPNPQLELNTAVTKLNFNLETLKFLVENGANVEQDNDFVLKNICSPNEYTSINEEERTKNALYLIKNHKNLQNNGSEILRLSAKEKNYILMEELLHKGIVLNPKNKNGIKREELEWINKFEFIVKLETNLDIKESTSKMKL